MKASSLLLAVLLAAPAIIQAHTHKVLMGTVKAFDGTRIELTLKNGKVQSIPLTKSSMIMRGNDMVGADQVKPGIRAVVVFAEDDRTVETIKLPLKPSRK